MNDPEGTKMMSIRSLCAATIALATIGASATVLGSGISVADTVTLPVHTWPNHPDLGTTFVSTRPGGLVDINISGRTQAAGSHCDLNVGNIQRRMEIDANGNGFDTFGPLQPGTYRLSGICYGQARNYSDVDAEMGYVTIDGAEAGSCSSSILNTMNRMGLRGDIDDAVIDAVTGKGLETTALQICAIIDASQPTNWINQSRVVFMDFCRVGKSLIPADLAYQGIAEIGRIANNNAVEEFFNSAADGWNSQCQ